VNVDTLSAFCTSHIAQKLNTLILRNFCGMYSCECYFVKFHAKQTNFDGRVKIRWLFEFSGISQGSLETLLR